MATYTGSRSSQRFLPASMEAGLARLFRRLAGTLILSLALAGWVCLLSWSFADPSLNHMTEKPPENLLGVLGATVADLLIQSLGLAAIAVFLPLAALGLRLATNVMAGGLRVMATLWPVSAGLIAMGLSALPVPETWPLVHGLGGIIGDFLMAGGGHLLAFVPGEFAKTLASACAAAMGFWTLLRASGLRLRDLAVLFESERSGYPSTRIPRAGLRARLRGLMARRRLRQKTYGAGQREFWMGEEWQNASGTSGRTGETHIRRRPNSGGDGDPAQPWTHPSGGDGFEGVRIEQGVNSHRTARRAPANRPHRSTHPERVRHAGASAQNAHSISSRSLGRGAFQRFTLPPLNLLGRSSGPSVQENLSDEELTARAEQLEGTLRDFGVKGEITDVHPGPVITLYELRPARGTKSSRVIGLADDIARSMGAVSARVSVVPGRDALGIELPNETRETVYLRALLETPEFRDSQSKLALALGKSISGAPVIADLARMPHLLVAGTTGSGKSVGINAMILSLLYRLPPDQCKFIMIDPKMLELSVYDGIPHLLTPVVTDPKKAVVALKWTVAEMNRRYERMHKLGVRNIQGYNQRVAEALQRGEVLGRTVNTGFDEVTGQPIYEHEDIEAEPMPYVVIVIDEMADLMMVAGKDIELAVQRLSQMARAAGIHVIMATQRPSVDVITGTIKANFPSRVSFQVTSKIDSRTIIGEQGAEQLLGAGDMLYLAPGGRLTRVHGPFVADAELEEVVRHLKQQGAPEYRADVLQGHDDPVDPRLSSEEKSGTEGLFSEAVEIVKRDRRATTSYLQRRLGIGYNRAASLIERLEDEGIIGPANRAGKREIFVDDRESA